jgi:uncharacterized protein YkwD
MLTFGPPRARLFPPIAGIAAALVLLVFSSPQPGGQPLGAPPAALVMRPVTASELAGIDWLVSPPDGVMPELGLPQALLLVDAVQRIAAFAAPPPAAPVPVTRPVAVRVPPPPPPQPRPAAVETWVDDALGASVLAEVNALRAQAGLPAFASHPQLAAAASSYALTLARHDWYDHTGPDGSSFASRIRAAGFTANVGMGEVIALGAGDWSGADFARAWMGSPGHRSLLMSGEYALAGAGCSLRRTAEGVSARCVIEVAG